MTARNLLNLLLAVVVIGLALLVVFEPGKAPPPAREVLTPLNAADIRRIEIAHGANTPVILEKQDEHWRLPALPGVTVNDAKIDTLLSLAAAVSHARYDVAAVDAEQSGLNRPELQITLGDTRLLFGGTEPLNGRRYVQVGERVHLIVDRYSYLVRGDIASFVDTGLLPAGSALSEIRLPGFSLREQDGHWVLHGGERAPGADELQRFVDGWRFARALRVSLLQGDTTGGEVIELQLGNQLTPLRFMLLQTDGETYLTRADLGLRYHFTASTIEGLLKLPMPSEQSD